MEIKDLKNMIETSSFDGFPIIFIYDSDTFLIHQYANAISDLTKKPISIKQDLNEVLQKQSLFETSDDDYINLLYADKLHLDKKTKIRDYTIIATKNVYTDSVDNPPVTITLPKIESWQIKDYVYSMLPEINMEDLNRLLDLCNYDIFRLEQEVKRLCLFEKQERQSVFKDFFNQGIFSDLSSYTIFDLSNAILTKDISKLKNILLDLHKIDVEAIGLLKILTDSFRQVIQVQLDVKSGKDYFINSLGWKPARYWAIKNLCGHYTRNELIKIFNFLTSIDFIEFDKDQLISYLICYIINI